MTAGLSGLIRFLQEAEGLKSVLRTAWTASGRRESTAEHTWRLTLFAALVLEHYPALDAARVLRMCLIHDLGELYDGDISAALYPDEQTKYGQERAAVERVFALLPEPLGEQMLALWTEYGENRTPEAKLVKALDKAETILQHNQGANPPDFDYAFNLGYGRELFEEDELLTGLRAELDRQTRARMDE